VSEACLDLESNPAVVRDARSFALAVARQWHLDALEDEVALVTSELVGNAVLHARTSISLILRHEAPETVTVEVHDENTRMPTVAGCPADATSGRGLSLVSALASAWGVRPDGLGKVVWARLGPIGVSH
jgi:anti-sigma regulatory factor (Ser/Thr protein kinase)